MADRSSPSESGPLTDVERAVEELTAVLLAVAQRDFGVRATRDYSGNPIDVLAFLANSTAEEVGLLVTQLEEERRSLQLARDHLVHAAKMTALGKLAAGVAHELNQPLTAIALLVDLLLAHPEKPIAECQEDLRLLARATRRMGRIVDNVRLFGRTGPLRWARFPADRPISEPLQLLTEQLSRAGIAIETDFPPAMPEVNADADRLQQVFVNLLTNARDALCDLEAGKPRCIKLQIQDTEHHVIYRIQDTGPGVAETNVQHIFDPFFTTKEVGQGTGLGLSLSHGIIADHGGSMHYKPAQHGGACFVIELPKSPNWAPGLQAESVEIPR